MREWLEKQLVLEVEILYEEANSLPPGDLRDAVNEAANCANRLLAVLRDEKRTL